MEENTPKDIDVLKIKKRRSSTGKKKKTASKIGKKNSIQKGDNDIFLNRKKNEMK